MISIDYTSRIPIYEQIVNEIERYVSFGVYKPNERIESVRELASNLGINPNTVKKAYDELERRKVITTISTKGTFITDNVKSITTSKIDEKINAIKTQISELEKLRNLKGRCDKKIKII